MVAANACGYEDTNKITRYINKRFIKHVFHVIVILVFFILHS